MTTAPGDGYQQVQTQRLHEVLVQQIVRQVVAGELPPCSALPTEPELAQRFGVSRTVVREAVRVLVAKGLVTVRHGSGMWVAPAEQWDYLDPLLVFEGVRSGRDGALLNELIEARRVLEMEVAALAAQRRIPDDLAALRSAVDGMAATLADSDAYTQWDIEFHDCVLAAARNRVLREALRPVAEVMRSGRLIAARGPDVVARSLAGHQAIGAAIERGDADGAREAMRRHIVQFEQDIRAALVPRDASPG